jgi:hypothetical protein
MILGPYSEAGPSAFSEVSTDRRSLGGGWSGPAITPGLKTRPPKTANYLGNNFGRVGALARSQLV